MILKALTLEDFKGIREPVRIEFAPLTPLFGPNNAASLTQSGPCRRSAWRKASSKRIQIMRSRSCPNTRFETTQVDDIAVQRGPPRIAVVPLHHFFTDQPYRSRSQEAKSKT